MSFENNVTNTCFDLVKHGPADYLLGAGEAEMSRDISQSWFLTFRCNNTLFFFLFFFPLLPAFNYKMCKLMCWWWGKPAARPPRHYNDNPNCTDTADTLCNGRFDQDTVFPDKGIFYSNSLVSSFRGNHSQRVDFSPSQEDINKALSPRCGCYSDIIISLEASPA